MRRSSPTLNAVVLGAGLMLGAAPVLQAAAATPAAFQTSAPVALLEDGESGAVLFERGADELQAPASTAKIMTAEMVFEALSAGRLSLDDKFVVSERAWRQGGAPSGGSTMFAKVNSQVRVEDLLRGLIVVSGNDAAIALAEGIAGTEDAFAARMTERARALGLSRSTFSNAWGRDEPGERVTARDMARLSLFMIKNDPTRYRMFAERDFTWNGIHQSNRNPLLALNIGADGLKTGETAQGGFGLVGSAVQEGRRLIVVVYGLKTAKERAAEAQKILAWGFRAFEARTLFTAGETVGSAKVFGGTMRRVPLVADGAVTLLQPREGGEALSGRILYQGPLPAPVEQGTLVAHLKLFRGTTEVLDVPLRAAQNVPVGSLPSRALDAGLELMAGVLRTDVLHR